MKHLRLVAILTFGVMLLSISDVTESADDTPTGLSIKPEDIVALLHTAFQTNPQLHQLVAAAAQIPDNITVTLSPELQQNPLFGIALKAFADLGQASNASSPDNSTGPAVVGGPQPPNVDLIRTLMMTSLLRDAVNIVQDEIQKGMVEAANKTVGQDIGSILGLIHPLTVLQRLLRSRSADMFLRSMPGKVNDQCHTDLVDTLDALVATKKWAIDMFDALGKPSSGIQRGSFYFVGSFDQCYMIKPHINKGDVLGAKQQAISRDFGTRFCRSDIGIPQSMIKSLNVDTKGIPLKLIMGLCVPDSCHKEDIQELMGSLLNITKTYCYEDTNLATDTSAMVCVVILTLFVLIIVIGTLYDACRSSEVEGGAGSAPLPVVQNGTSKANGTYHVQGSTNGAVSNGDVKVEIPFAEPAIKKADLPAGYMQHREGEPEYSNYTNISTITQDSKPYTNVNITHVSATETKVNKIVKHESILERVVLCFSLYTNVPKLLAARSSPGAVACVHGIRFLSLTWVVLGHTYNYGIVSMDETFTADNLLDFVPIMQRFTFQGVIAGGFSVDTFFVLSAFLLTWLQLKELTKKKRFTCMDGFYYYFHRFWRLTPMYMMVMMMFACLYQYLGSGPFWPSTIWGAEHCKTVWWTNLLYVNNLVETGSQCMGWTWYLANDMQFYVITPIFLALMYKFSMVGVVSTAVLLATGVGIAYWQEHVYNGNFFTMKSDGGAYWNNVYIVPWCRVSPWAVGMLLGYILFRRGNKPIKNKFLVYAGWLLATGVALFVTYINYTELKEDGTPWTRDQRSAYESFGRAAWGVCVAWVIFACYTGSGGIVNSILSWRGFIPLSRLSYAAYLVHPICMMTYIFSRRALLHVTDYSIIYLFLGHLSIAYMVAFVCSLAFEAPFMALEKVLFRPNNKRK